MNNTRDKLRAARATLGPLVERRGPTTEAELDECAQTLKELERACAVASSALNTTPAEVGEFLTVLRASLNVVSERIKNRPRGQGTSKP